MYCIYLAIDDGSATMKVVLTFQFVGKILNCDHSK